MSNIETVVLDNGLKIYLYVDKRRHSTFFQLITLFGGKDKDFKCDGKTYHIQDGLAHILEHYVVEENANGNFLKILGEAQMGTNASTGFDRTSYYFEAVENLEFGIETMIKGVYKPIFSEERLEKIKKPILQEIRGKMDSKFYHSHLTTLNNIFSKIKVRSIGGTLEEISNTTLEDIETCFKAFYQPSNQMIVIGGNFDKDKIIELIKKIYSEIEIEKHELVKIIPNENSKVVRKRGIVEFPTGQNYTEVNYKISLKNFSPEERLKLDFYLYYFLRMSFGVTSKVYNELVKDKVITTGISTEKTTFYDYILVSVGSYTDKPKVLEDKIKEVFTKFNTFDQEYFDISKKETILQIVLRSENLFDTLIPFVENVVVYDYPHPDSVQMIDACSFKDFEETIKNLDFNNYTITTIKNKTED